MADTPRTTGDGPTIFTLIEQGMVAIAAAAEKAAASITASAEKAEEGAARIDAAAYTSGVSPDSRRRPPISGYTVPLTPAALVTEINRYKGKP